MARPTKEERAKKEALKETGIFRRDNPIYTDFEESVKGFKRLDKVYIFCNECGARFKFNTKKQLLDAEEIVDFDSDIYMSLAGIDEKLATFFTIVHREFLPMIVSSIKPFHFSNVVTKHFLYDVFGGEG